MVDSELLLLFGTTPLVLWVAEVAERAREIDYLSDAGEGLLSGTGTWDVGPMSWVKKSLAHCRRASNKLTKIFITCLFVLLSS